MGESRDFVRYALISFTALAATIIFWNLLVMYLGDIAVFLYRYEVILIPVMLILVVIISASALHLEPKKRLLYPIRWILIRLRKSGINK
jgi:hypothetical protein